MALGRSPYVLDVAGANIFGHQRLDTLADQRAAVEAEQALAFLVDQFDPSVALTISIAAGQASKASRSMSLVSCESVIAMPSALDCQVMQRIVS